MSADYCPTCGGPTATCAYCGRLFTRGRVDKLYCSRRHKEAAHFKRTRGLKA